MDPDEFGRVAADVRGARLGQERSGVRSAGWRTRMVAKAREIDVLPGSELARIIDESNGAPLYLVKDGVRSVWSERSPRRQRTTTCPT